MHLGTHCAPVISIPALARMQKTTSVFSHGTLLDHYTVICLYHPADWDALLSVKPLLGNSAAKDMVIMQFLIYMQCMDGNTQASLPDTGLVEVILLACTLSSQPTKS